MMRLILLQLSSLDLFGCAYSTLFFFFTKISDDIMWWLKESEFERKKDTSGDALTNVCRQASGNWVWGMGSRTCMIFERSRKIQWPCWIYYMLSSTILIFFLFLFLPFFSGCFSGSLYCCTELSTVFPT